MLFFTFLFFCCIKIYQTLSPKSKYIWLNIHIMPPHQTSLHALTVLFTQLKSKSNSDCYRGISASASLLMIYRGCGGEIYFKAPVCVYTYTCNHIVYMICATHAWQLDIYAKAIDTLTKCFSHFLFSCAKEHSEDEMHDWVRETEWIGGRKALKPFLLFVAEPRFFPLSPSYSMILFVF